MARAGVPLTVQVATLLLLILAWGLALVRMRRGRRETALRAAAGSWVGAGVFSIWEHDLAWSTLADPDALRACLVERLAEVHASDLARVESCLLAALRREGSYDVVYRCTNGAGEGDRWRRDVGQVIFAQAWRRWRFVGISLDVTEGKATEQALVAAKAEAEASSQAKLAFLAYMCHEIRTPLSAILGFCEILEDPQLPDADRSGAVRVMRRNGELLKQIVDDVLDLSRIEVGRLSVERMRVSLRKIVSEVCASLKPAADGKGIELVEDYDECAPQEINSDPLRLKQILLNVLNNAVKFTDRGRVSLQVRGLPPARGSMPWSVEFLVKDTGIGFTDEQRSRLFQPYGQAEQGTARKYGGSGLGLVLARSLAQRLGGDVELVDSCPGGGSTFRVRVESADMATMQATR